MPVTIAIIGRPNVGKSTLFNRLVGRRLALVDDRPGVTRDRRQGEAAIGDLNVSLIDTAGLEDAADETLAGRMRAQTDAAIDEADLVLFMIDARAGVTPTDEHFADMLRRRFADSSDFRTEADTDLVEGSILDLDAEGKFDYVVCGLPFNNFEPELVDQMLGVMVRALKPEGKLVEVLEGGQVEGDHRIALRGLELTAAAPAAIRTPALDSADRAVLGPAQELDP